MQPLWEIKSGMLSLLLAALMLGGCASRNDLPTGSTPESVANSKSNSEEITNSEMERIEHGEQLPSNHSSSSEGSSVLSEEDWRDSWELLLVNKENPLSADYLPALAEVQNGYQMEARVAPFMIEMLAAAQADGVDLMVISAYRPYERQASNFERHVKNSIASGYSEAKAREIAHQWIALPGESEHQAGLCADIVTPTYTNLDEGYADTEAAKWLLANASEFGFALRYPKDKTAITTIAFEPWHYRYVGKEHAAKIMQAGICLEEYLAEPEGTPLS